MFIPEDFQPPALITDTYIARKLCAKDVYLDYIAVMSSIDTIHKVRNSNWPKPTLTIEDDLIDLSWHQREFEFRSSFAYTVMNKEETKCLGCIYLYPTDEKVNDNEKYDVEISWWVTTESYGEGFYEVLSQDIKHWIEQKWPFKKVYWSNRELPLNFTEAF